MERREFLTKLGLTATWAAVAIRVSACGDDDPAGPGNGNGGSSGATGSVGTNHGHVVGITQADLDAGTAVTLTLSCVGHEHTVDLSSADVMNIADGNSVTRTSSSDAGHTHSVTFQLA